MTDRLTEEPAQKECPLSTRPENVVPFFRPKHLADLTVEEWHVFDSLLETHTKEKRFNSHRVNEIRRIIHKLERIAKKCDDLCDPTADHENAAMILFALINGSREALAHNQEIMNQFDGFCVLYHKGHYTKKTKPQYHSTTG